MSEVPFYEIRDEIYVRFGIQKALSEFVINSFGLAKTYYPKDDIEPLKKNYPTGRVYVVALCPGDLDNLGRSNNTLRDFGAAIGVVRVLSGWDDLTTIDEMTRLVAQLEESCIKNIDHDGNDYSFSRSVFAKDEAGLPLSFVGLRNTATFEAYFNVFYKRALV